MIQSGSLGAKPSETLRRVARYYLDSGCSKRDARKNLESFLLKCDPSASLVRWSECLDYALRRAAKYPAVNIDYIGITKDELSAIDSLDGKQVKKLAFTLLCLAKYWIAIAPRCNGWVKNKDTEIMALANIKTSIKRQSVLYWTLHEHGLIQFSKLVDNTNVRVCFLSDGDPALKVVDFRNLGFQYSMYCGEPYFECECCGVTTQITNPENKRRQRYCKPCATKLHIQNAIERTMAPYFYMNASKNDAECSSEIRPNAYHFES